MVRRVNLVAIGYAEKKTIVLREILSLQYVIDEGFHHRLFFHF